jgi:hypothetical protein
MHMYNLNTDNLSHTPYQHLNLQQHPKHHATPLQAKLVREFITLLKCHIQINNDPKDQFLKFMMKETLII